MPEQNLQQLDLEYGDGRRLRCEIPTERVVAVRRAPSAQDDPAPAFERALQNPLDFPPLKQAVFPGDHVVVVLDRDLPADDLLVAEIWKQFSAAGLQPEDVELLHPGEFLNGDLCDPRRGLPADVAGKIAWNVHDFRLDDGCGYLASSASGDRVYLSRRVLEADVVLTAGVARFDPVLGYRGTNSVLYPGLSNEESARRAQGVGHLELAPEDERPLRSLIDEIGWLLGNQFTVQVLPAAGGGVANVLAGISESVLRAAKRLINQHWMVRLPTRCELAVVAVDGSASGNAWGKLGSAVAAARNLVTRGGKIVVLSEMDDEPGDGMEILREAREPADALKPLQSFSPADLLPASQIASAADWAQVYLLSRMPADLVEELFMIPVDDETGVQKLIAGEESCVLLEGGQFITGRVGR